MKTTKAKRSPSIGGAAGAIGQIYQKRVAAWWLARVLIQSTTIAEKFGLAKSLPTRVYGHTNDDVDDLRVEFGPAGKLYVQCKRSLRVSTSLSSEFGKAWQQFARQFSSLGQQSAPTRCVLAYESGNTTLDALRTLFQRARLNPDWNNLEECGVTQKQKDVGRKVAKLHKEIQKAHPNVPVLREVVLGVYLHKLALEDDSDARISTADSLTAVLTDHQQVATAAQVLIDLGEELTKQRALFFDLTLVRARLRENKVKLRDVPEFYPDLNELDAQSTRTFNRFKDNHRNRLNGRFTLPRPVENEVVTKVTTGNLLVVGEPGAGKTGVLMAAADNLKQQGKRVWFLSVEDYQADSLPLLERELNLTHHLSEIFGMAAEEGRVCLLVDGLDAAREHGRQKTWRTLVSGAKRANITVIATIRVFDLQNSPAWQQLFSIHPDNSFPTRTDSLEQVRLINVNELTDSELDEALRHFATVQQVCAGTPSVKRLARNIFNLQLLCDLSATGLPHNALQTQLELLRAWWATRVGEETGSSLKPMLTIAVERMVSARRLQCSGLELDSSALREAKRVGLIRSSATKLGFSPSENVEFTHNVLFDYSAFELLVAPRRDALTSELKSGGNWGLFLRPSINYYFCWLWNDYRQEFWHRALAMQSSSIPTLHKTLVWLTVSRNTNSPDDFAPLIDGMVRADEIGQTWLDLARGVNGCAEATVWKSLFRNGDGMWWVEYAIQLLSQKELNITLLGWQILYSLYYENKEPRPDTLPIINRAARLEVETHWNVAVPFGPGSKASIWLFCRTIDGDKEASAALIRRMIAREELEKSGYFRGREVANEIRAVAQSVPELAIEIFSALYGHKEESFDQVPMGRLYQMNKHDLYSSGHYELQQALPDIFTKNPRLATRAVCRVFAEGNLGQQEKDETGIWFQFDGHQIFAAGSIIHAESLGKNHDDRTKLLDIWCECLKQLVHAPDKDEKWRAVREGLVMESNAPNVWAALFAVCAGQADLIGASLWPVFSSLGVLSCLPFMKLTCNAVSTLAKTSETRVLHDWQRIVMSLDRDDLRRRNYRNTGELLKTMQARYLSSLPGQSLTNESKTFLANNSTSMKEDNGNYDDLFRAQRLLVEKERTGLDPGNPLHVTIEKDLAGLQLGENAKTDASILRKIGEIDKHFQTLEASVRERLRGQFQNLISHQLRNLSLNSKALPPSQLSEALSLCAGLIETRSGRQNALEAVTFFLGPRKKLTKTQKTLLRRIASMQEHEVVEYFGARIWAFLDNWPRFVFDCLENWANRLNEKDFDDALQRVLQQSWFWWLMKKDRKRALRLLNTLLLSARQYQHLKLYEGFLAWFMAVTIEDGDEECGNVVRTALSSPVEFSATNFDMTRVLTEWLFPRQKHNFSIVPQKFQRAVKFANLLFEKALAALKDFEQQQISLPPPQRTTVPPPWIKPVYLQFHQFANEMRFNSEAILKSFDSLTTGEYDDASKQWWSTGEAMLNYLMQAPHPDVARDRIAAFKSWLPYQPNHTIHWLRLICEAGVKLNIFQDRLIVTDVTGILKQCLSEHRDLLHADGEFLADFAGTLDAMFSTATPDALIMAATLDEFYR